MKNALFPLLVICSIFAAPVAGAKTVLFLGDSITDARHIGCTTNYWGFLAERYGFAPRVFGVNGHSSRQLCWQLERYQSEHPGETPDLVSIFIGTNDFNGNVPLGEWYSYDEQTVNRNGREVKLRHREFVLDEKTFRGRLNVGLKRIRELFPTTPIVLLTPVHRGYATFGAKNVQPDESYANEIGLFIDDYVNAVREAGSVWAARVIDLYSVSGILPNVAGQGSLVGNPERDRLHPSTVGHKLIADQIALEIGEMLGR